MTAHQALLLSSVECPTVSPLLQGRRRWRNCCARRRTSRGSWGLGGGGSATIGHLLGPTMGTPTLSRSASELQLPPALSPASRGGGDDHLEAFTTPLHVVDAVQVDLHGMSVDEAIAKLEQHVHSLSGLSSATFILQVRCSKGLILLLNRHAFVRYV